MDDFKIPVDVAESDFARFVEFMDIDVDPSRMNEEDQKSFDNQKHILIRSICNGNLTIDEFGVPTFTPVKGDAIARQPLTFREPDGATMLALDKHGKNAGMAKTYSVLAEMAKVTPSHFAKMANRDLKVCQALGALFLG